MSKIPKPISNYVERFLIQYKDLKIENIELDEFSELIIQEKSQINNMLMSGLGASTLILRLSAVINLSIKLDEGSDEEDALLMKQILDNIREVLPSDTNWKNILKITSDNQSLWYKCVNAEGSDNSIMDRFVTFRNKFVHEIILLKPDHAKKVLNGINVLKSICLEVAPIFENSEFKETEGKYYFIQKTGLLRSKKICLYPFVQPGEEDDLPYIFQGLYDNKTTAELISTFYGDVEEQKGSEHYDQVFNPIIESLKGGAGKVFDHSDRISYYNECFVGREDESIDILNWLQESNEKNNILPIFSDAGMGKGALISNIITELNDLNIPVLYHFCSSGLSNNLQAVLYHLILQAKKRQLWNLDDERIMNKVKRLPSKYPDLINLFHELIDNYFVKTRKNTVGNLIIIIDGLDEASVAYPEYNISEYFNTYNENDEVEGDWQSKPNIKWIFTYRKGFYNFPELLNILDLASVQPLLGLKDSSVNNALKKFNPSEDFIQGVIDKGRVV